MPGNTSSRKSSESTLHSVDPPDAERPLAKLDFNFIPIPKHLRYFASRPPTFNLALNILFGVGSTFCEFTIAFHAQPDFVLTPQTPAVANLYYCQPLLSMFPPK
jgi:hypothetical protein